MNRRQLLSSAVLFLFLPGPLRAELQSLDAISAYLNSLTLVETTFRQTNADGSVSAGRLFLRRPNRMRFEYDKPETALVLASSGSVAIFDSKSNQPPERYPLKRTPLNLILGRDIDLARARMVVDHSEVKGRTVILAQDPDHPEYGSIALHFDPGPVLVKWVITDDLGQKTRVELGPLTPREDFPATLFNIEAEMQRRGLSGG